MQNLIDLQKIQPKVSNITFIAVDGHGGSGKSSLAEFLSNELNAEIIHTDDFASWDNPTDWWPSVIKNVFEKIEKGEKTLSYPRSKWWKDHNPEPVRNQQVTNIMLIEGVSSMRKEFAPYIGLGIFVDTPRDICLERGIQRDMSTGKSKEEVTKLWNDWLDEEDSYFDKDNPMQRADIIVDGTKSFEDQVTFKI